MTRIMRTIANNNTNDSPDSSLNLDIIVVRSRLVEIGHDLLHDDDGVPNEAGAAIATTLFNIARHGTDDSVMLAARVLVDHLERMEKVSGRAN